MKSLLILIVLVPLLALGGAATPAAADLNRAQESMCWILPWFCDRR